MYEEFLLPHNLVKTFMKLSFGILVPMIDFDFMRIFILEAIENKNGMPPFHDREQIFFMNKTGKSLN